MNDSYEPLTNRTTNNKWRTVLFSIGVIAALLSAAAGVCSWVESFSTTLRWSGRGYRLNPLEGRILIAGISTGLLTMILAAFGRRVGRVSLVVIGLLLIVFNMLGWLGNHR